MVRVPKKQMERVNMMSRLIKTTWKPSHASKALSPLWDDFTRMEQQMEQMFGSLAARGAGSATHTIRSINTDIRETETAYELTAELAGVEEKDISLSYDDGILTLSGEKQCTYEEGAEGQQLHRVERSYGAFSRSFQFGDTVDDEKITATFKNGVLTVTLPKQPTLERKPKTIQIGAS